MLVAAKEKKHNLRQSNPSVIAGVPGENKSRKKARDKLDDGW